MSSLVQQLPDIGPRLSEAVSHVSLLLLVPAEGGVEGQQSLLLPPLQLSLVDVVLGLVPTSKVEQCGSNWLALALLPGPLLIRRVKSLLPI